MRGASPQWILAGAFCLCSTAWAAESEGAVFTAQSVSKHHFDVGVSGGLNNPGGVYAAELSYWLHGRLTVGAAVGNGAWGVRVTPEVRLYLLPGRAGLLAELGSSMNFGSDFQLSVNGRVFQSVHDLFTPTANTSLGYRFALGDNGWLLLRAGWAFRLRQDNVRTTGGPGGIATVIPFLQPGGFIAGLSVGFSIL